MQLCYFWHFFTDLLFSNLIIYYVYNIKVLKNLNWNFINNLPIWKGALLSSIWKILLCDFFFFNSSYTLNKFAQVAGSENLLYLSFPSSLWPSVEKEETPSYYKWTLHNCSCYWNLFSGHGRKLLHCRFLTSKIFKMSNGLKLQKAFESRFVTSIPSTFL